MRIMQDLDTARRPVLARRSWDAIEITSALQASITRVFGEPLSPDQAVERILRDVRRDGDAALLDYNRRIVAGDQDHMPYIVVFIDELADLMMIAPDEVERSICRIAQMARATGIHLIIATQRPSVDVVTGLIKANFPARISFAVTSQVDSRVIIDSIGADKLLGRGDMLFMAPDSSKLVRLQGCFVSDKELSALVRYWKGVRAAQEPIQPEAVVQQPMWDEIEAAEAQAAQEDELLPKAIAIVQEHERASISMLQRRLRIGYSRAARLIDTMERQGLVGPAPGGSSSREVLLSDPKIQNIGQGDKDLPPL